MFVRLSGVGHSFDGGPPLLSGIDLHAPSGSMVALVGPSGSGKSTLLAIIAGSLAPVEGIVERGGGRCLWVLQSPVGVPQRTALDHVVLPLLASGTERAAAEMSARTALEAFALGHRASARFGELSGGERQRLMLARARVCQADLVLIDEPTSQLDRDAAALVAASLRGVLEEDCDRVVIVATHDNLIRDACTLTLDVGRPVA